MPWAHLERLAAHPQLWVSAADQLGSGVALVARADLRYLVVNDALAQMNGVPVEEHIGRSVPEVMPARHWQWLEPLYERVFDGEQVTTRYSDVDDGGSSTADIRLSPVWEDDEVAAVLVVVTDVSVSEAVRLHSDQLLALALELNLADSLEDVAEATAAHSRHRLGAVDTGVYWRKDHNTLVRLSRELSMAPTVGGLDRVGVAQDVPVAAAVRGGQVMWLEDPQDWDRFPMFRESVEELGWPVVGILPLGARGAVNGALYLTFEGGRVVPPHERQAARTLAALCEAAVDRMVRDEQSRAVANRLDVTRGRLEAIDAMEILAVARGDAASVRSANDRFLQLTGLAEIPPEGIPWADLTPTQWSDTDSDAFDRVRLGAAPVSYEKELWHRDGRRVPVHVSARRSREQPFEVTSVVLDLTEVKDDERRSRQVLEDRDRLSQAVQTALLPAVPAVAPGLDAPVVAAYQPGDERLALGGDFYDVVPTVDGRLGLLVGDVCGHGPLAAAAGAACRIAWRTSVLGGDTLLGAALTVDRVLRSERKDEALFATIISALYDPTTREIEILNAGHPAPVLIDLVAGHRTLTVDHGPLLGVVDDADYVTNRVTLDVGQALLLYTDGLVEGRAHPGSVERLGDRGLHELLAGLSPTDLLRPQRVIQAANDRHGSNLPDDVALLVVMGPDSAEASGIPDGVRPLTA